MIEIKANTVAELIYRLRSVEKMYWNMEPEYIALSREMKLRFDWEMKNTPGIPMDSFRGMHHFVEEQIGKRTEIFLGMPFVVIHGTGADFLNFGYQKVNIRRVHGHEFPKKSIRAESSQAVLASEGHGPTPPLA